MGDSIATLQPLTFDTSCLEDLLSTEENRLTMHTHLHKPVMLKEAIELLALRRGQVVLDGTAGAGGHALSLIEGVMPTGKLIALDKDEEILSLAKERLKKYASHCIFAHADFRNLDKVLDEHRIEGVDAVLLDLGVSSFQLDNPQRGFSFKAEGPLDMRMDRQSFISAFDLLNTLTEEEIASILWRFGQERFSRRIAHAIVRLRAGQSIATTKQLADIVARALPYKSGFHKIHPATRTFQALRIAVNRELEALDDGLKKAALYLNKGGRICVISFHSLEDKIVKENFRQLAKTSKFRLIVKKILRPSWDEIKENPRSRSAKMRVIERVR